MSPTKWRLLAVTTGALLLTSAYYKTHTAAMLAESATAFLNSLTPEQKAKATFKFEDEERFNWHFIPRARKGLPFREMTGPQKQLAHGLLNAAYSQQGYQKASYIMSLDDILRIMENDNGERRNSEGYYFSIFGEPSEKGTWGFRFEGHHVALNLTMVNGRVAGSPNFFGSNPAEVREGPRKGLRALGREEDLGRELLMALTPEQKKVAIVSGTALRDIITMADRKAALKGQPNGLQASKMNAKQKALLEALVEEYAHNLPEQVAQARLDKLKKAGTNIYFAWTGVEEKGGPHYYRVQAPEFLIEYDNTQNNNNHIHSVWRDYEGDFGLDLLKMHYESSAHK
jgi:hypothetical protein